MLCFHCYYSRSIPKFLHYTYRLDFFTTGCHFNPRPTYSFAYHSSCSAIFHFFSLVTQGINLLWLYVLLIILPKYLYHTSNSQLVHVYCCNDDKVFQKLAVNYVLSTKGAINGFNCNVKKLQTSIRKFTS